MRASRFVLEESRTSEKYPNARFHGVSMKSQRSPAACLRSHGWLSARSAVQLRSLMPLGFHRAPCSGGPWFWHQRRGRGGNREGGKQLVCVSHSCSLGCACLLLPHPISLSLHFPNPEPATSSASWPRAGFCGPGALCSW